MNYKVIHTGEGTFKVILENGEVKDAGRNLIGMIRYTYFEDFQLPPTNWEVTRKQLLEDYQPKVMNDVLNGKIKNGEHEFGQTDWIQKI